jgi:hypothetical protein
MNSEVAKELLVVEKRAFLEAMGPSLAKCTEWGLIGIVGA